MLPELLSQYYGERCTIEHSDDDENRTACTIAYLMDNGMNEDMISEVISLCDNSPAMTIDNLPSLPVFVCKINPDDVDSHVALYGDDCWKRYNGYYLVNKNGRQRNMLQAGEIKALLNNDSDKQEKLVPFNLIDVKKLYLHPALRLQENMVIVDGRKTMNRYYSEPKLLFTFRDFVNYICDNSNVDFERLYTRSQFSFFYQVLYNCRSNSKDIGEPIDILMYTVDYYLSDVNDNIWSIVLLNDSLYNGREYYREKLTLFGNSEYGKYVWRNEPCRI